MQSHFDVVVIGGGHAGCEAAAAAARMGATTCLMTQSATTIGAMSCNPAIGGLGKGQLVREIDALDGLMGRMADAAGIQFRVLNRSKGPAVRGPRAQIDRKLYRNAMQRELANYNNLTLLEAEVVGLSERNGSVASVTLSNGQIVSTSAVVITTGTFLRGMIHIGAETIPAGRMGEGPSVGLAKSLETFGFVLGRLKTGTPPRLDGNTIDWSALQVQPGDDVPEPFSTLTERILTTQIPCHVTRTTSRGHDIIHQNMHRAAIHTGAISGRGPRYCPSIEDKVVRFADRDTHQVFLEPEGLDDNTIYPNGISTSLPIDVQTAFVRTMPGLEHVRFIKPGYAIEYDFVEPRQLKLSLETKALPGLFLAGQINGTTGYEEAAAQGLVAGLNAANFAKGKAPVMFSRAAAYLGVMIDDLVTRGVSEPYRMFTSRAEYRLSLRADNADQRLTPFGIETGCVGTARQVAWQKKSADLSDSLKRLKELQLSPNEAGKLGFIVNKDGVRRTGFELLARSEINYEMLASVWPDLRDVSARIAEQVEIEAKYAVYLDRQNADVELFKRDEALNIPVDCDFAAIPSLSTEVRSKLLQIRPTNMGWAGRIEGMTPVALSILAGYVRQRHSTKPSDKAAQCG